MPNKSLPSRRTQAERRASTRTALLDATIQSLIKHGYARLTTNDIVRRAGVTRGAQAHHFTSKADLMVQALDYLTEKLLSEAETTISPLLQQGGASYELLLDGLWELHRGPLFTAAIEMWVAARTDTELRTHLRRFQRELVTNLHLLAARYLPTVAASDRFTDSVGTALAAMRGVAMLSFTANEDVVDLAWSSIRRELLQAELPAASEMIPPR
jgi:AcrR family transcriptional regulator